MAEQGPDGEPAIGVANFLAFAGGARRVGYGDFCDLLAHAAELGSHFGTELEAAASQINLRDQGAAEDFIAGGLVVDARAIEQIGEMGEKLCAQEESQATFGAG